MEKLPQLAFPAKEKKKEEKVTAEVAVALPRDLLPRSNCLLPVFGPVCAAPPIHLGATLPFLPSSTASY